jgi:hypothetical protein
MQLPPFQQIHSEIDSEGRLVLIWEVMGPLMSRVTASLLVGIAGLWVWIGHSMPGEFWGLIQAQDPGGPDWLGLAITGAGSVFFGCFSILLLLVAWRIAFRPQPERLVLGSHSLVYEPGSAGLIPAGRGRAPLWRSLLNIAKYEVAKGEFGGATLDYYNRVQFVTLQLGARRMSIGRQLQMKEQEQLVQAITQWQQQP